MPRPHLPTISYPRIGVGRIRDAFLTRYDSCSENFCGAFRNCRWTTGREGNALAAIFSMLGMVIIFVGLLDDTLISMEGGHCTLKQIGVALFYSKGNIWTMRLTDSSTRTMYAVGKQVYADCVTEKIVDIFHGLMGIGYVAVATTLAAFCLDAFGTKGGFMTWLRRNSIFNIFSVIFCVLVVTLTYWISLEVEQQQKESTATPENVRVSLDRDIYYFIVGAALNICSVVVNLIEHAIKMKRRVEDRLSLLENMEHDTLSSAAVNRENLLRFYHQQYAGANRTSTLNVGDAQSEFSASALAAGLAIAERPVGSTGPPPPLQMLLNVPPPPPYTP